MKHPIALLSLAASLAACLPSEAEPEWDFGPLPPGVQAPRVPEDNPMSAAKVALGEKLFEDVRLSGNGTQACATCHDAARAFTEDRATSVGSTGGVHSKNAPTLVNAAFLTSFGWANPLLRTLERHAPVPLFGEDPVELGLTDTASVADAYRAEIDDAFGDVPDLQAIIHALTSYQRTLIAFDTPYDRGELSTEAIAGQAIFEDRGCIDCHVPPHFTDGTSLTFHNNGLAGDPEGLAEVTFDDDDRGFFKVPTLRNVTRTAPYMHDGRFRTLDEVLDHYTSPIEAERAEIEAIALDEAERAALLAFLRSLSDR